MPLRRQAPESVLQIESAKVQPLLPGLKNWFFLNARLKRGKVFVWWKKLEFLKNGIQLDEERSPKESIPFFAWHFQAMQFPLTTEQFDSQEVSAHLYVRLKDWTQSDFLSLVFMTKKN